MATNRKHIAVYLETAVQEALEEFCANNGLESKKGLMYSAAVNKALAQYFQLENITTLSNTPNTAPSNTSNDTPDTAISNTLEQRLTEIEQRLTQKMAEMKEEILGESAA